MKVYIVTDLEGVNCVVLPRQTGLTGIEDPMYQQARHLLTMEVNAAVEGAAKGGADEVLVLDGHGANSGYNIILEEASDKAEYIVGSPGGRYLPELDETFKAVFIIGQHSMAGTKDGVLDHTMSSQTWVNAYINGLRVGEIGFIAYYAGHFGVPVAMVSGDFAACREAKNLIGDGLEIAPVKFGISRTRARCLPLSKSRKLIAEAAERGVRNADSVKPLVVKPPVEVKVELLNTSAAGSFLSRRGASSVDERTVLFRGKDVLEAYDNMFG